MKRAYQYIRISEKEQSNWSLSGQSDTNRQYCEKNGIEIVETFEDDGKSAKNFDRPGWQSLMDAIKRHHRTIDFLIVAKYDRIIRNVAEGLATIERIEQRYGVKVLSVMENINISPHSPFFFKLRADMLVNAEFERRVISDRSKFGTMQAKAQGRFIGQAPFGYRNARDSQNRPIIQPDSPEKGDVIRFIYGEFLSGKDMKQIARNARLLGFTRGGHDAIRRVLTNPVYIGQIIVPAYGDHPERTIRGNHPGIVSEDVFFEAQERLGLRKAQPKLIENDEVPLRGYVLCQSCGNPLTGGKSKGRTKHYYYYRCNTCTGQNFSAAKSHAELLDIFKQLSLLPEDIATMQQMAEVEFERQIKTRAGSLNLLNRELEELSKKLNAVEDKYFGGQIDDLTYKKWGGIYRRDLQGKKSEVEELMTGKEDLLKRFSTLLPRLSDLVFIWRQCNFYEKHSFLELMFGQEFTRLNRGYRTNFLQPIFDANGKIIKYLEIIENGNKTDKIGQIPVCAPNGLSIEPIIHFFAALKVA